MYMLYRKLIMRLCIKLSLAVQRINIFIFHRKASNQEQKTPKV